MKQFFIMLIVIVLPQFSFAQIEDEKEKQFELEVETNQIHDAEAEREAAQQETARQEKNEKARKKQLDALKAQKQREMDKNSKAITAYRSRIIAAEKKIKGYDAEIAKMNAINQKLQVQANAMAAKTKSVEDTANAAKQAMDQKHRLRENLIKQTKQSQANIVSADADIRKMKVEYAKLVMETNNLEGHLRMIQQAEAQRAAARQEAERNVSSMKQRRDTADQAVQQKQGSR